jgi:hypothetical protein
MRVEGTPTIAWHPRKDDIHIDDELLSSRSIDYDGGFEVNAAVVDEFEQGGKNDDGE